MVIDVGLLAIGGLAVAKPALLNEAHFRRIVRRLVVRRKTWLAWLAWLTWLTWLT